MSEQSCFFGVAFFTCAAPHGVTRAAKSVGLDRWWPIQVGVEEVVRICGAIRLPGHDFGRRAGGMPPLLILDRPTGSKRGLYFAELNASRKRAIVVPAGDGRQTTTTLIRGIYSNYQEKNVSLCQPGEKE